jgi:Sulfotransferase family
MSSPPEQRPRVIYVMGAGRSGSTTLGICLGNCAGVFYAGELDNWLVRSGTPQVEDAERTRFWAGVRERLGDPERAAALFGHEAQRAIERSLSVFRVNKWGARRRLRGDYRAVAEDLYRALTGATGAAHIADTSHYPLRAIELQQIAGIELYLVFLARDPQGVVASFNRHDVEEFTKSTIHTNVYLWVTHLLAMLAFLRHPRDRRIFVRYEDFVGDPGGVLAQILAVSGSDAAPPGDFSSLRIGFPLQGNRVTREETLTLRPSSDRPRRSSRLTAVLQSPLTGAMKRLRPVASVAARHPAATARRPGGDLGTL